MKAILIDTPNHKITEVDYDGDFHSIYKLIRASVFTTVRINTVDGTDVDVFVDDEGLINGNPHGDFMVWTHPWGPTILRGYGLVLGIDENGASVDAPVDVDWVRARVSFLSPRLEPPGH
jgi:hypothetical protein